MKTTLLKARETVSSSVWTTIWTARMTPNTDATAAPGSAPKKPRLAHAIATALGEGYIHKAPGKFVSLVGVASAYLSAAFFLLPSSVAGVSYLRAVADDVVTV